MANLNKVRCSVARARKTPGFNKRFHQQRFITISPSPIRSQSPQRYSQHVRRQVRHAYMWQNQKAAVVHNLVQLLLPRLVAPPDPLVPRLHFPGRRREGQSAKPAMFLTPNQVTHLAAAQRPCPQVVILFHQLIPDPRFGAVAAIDPDHLHRLQRFQHCLNVRFYLASSIHTRAALLTLSRKRSHFWQPYRTTPMQLQQCRPAIHFFQPSVPRSPFQLFTNSPRQLHPRKSWILIDHLLDSPDHCFVDLLPSNFHVANLQTSSFRVQQKVMGHAQAVMQGGE